mmetsp:Transcript_64889/g.174187  ORF Transcript_64889/g.174187 Transcript_64889/m.174187 type:complete len:374 (-) Transcript_64889:963-2084(-)
MVDSTVLASRKRKRKNETDKIACEMSRIVWNNTRSEEFSCKNEKVVNTRSLVLVERCTWNEAGAQPAYCKSASLKYEANLPDREFLTRYSVSCVSCYPELESVVHLHCLYCKEVLTGAIANPGGKISDHLITIRHVYNTSLALRESLIRYPSVTDTFDLALASLFLNLLKRWSEAIHVPSKSTITREGIARLCEEMERHVQNIWRLSQAAPPIPGSGPRSQSLCLVQGSSPPRDHPVALIPSHTGRTSQLALAPTSYASFFPSPDPAPATSRPSRSATVGCEPTHHASTSAGEGSFTTSSAVANSDLVRVEAWVPAKALGALAAAAAAAAAVLLGRDPRTLPLGCRLRCCRRSGRDCQPAISPGRASAGEWQW